MSLTNVGLNQFFLSSINLSSIITFRAKKGSLENKLCFYEIDIFLD